MENIYFREKYLSKIREFYHDADLIKVITGIRRSGKSCLMQMIKTELMNSGIPEKNILYFNLDKREYRFIKTDEQLDQYIEKISSGIDGKKYLFIDEIQNVKGFETVINGYREEGDYSIFITGSNSYLLSGELMTKLTGRYLTFEVFPLTFDEYIGMKKHYGMDVSSDLDVEFGHYLIEGGFPRTLFYSSLADKRKYVSEIVQEIFEKDIRRRVVIKKPETFRLVRDYLINNSGASTSIRNILADLNKNGFAISKTTLSRYLRALIDAKVLYECDRFDLKSKKMLSGEKKYYLADLSLSFVTNPDSRVNYGQVLENMVFLYAKSMGYHVSIGKIGKLECDFILKDLMLDYSYVQVCYSILQNESTEDREYRSLEMIHDNYPKYVLTMDKLIQKRNGIIHENILDFMAKQKKF